MFGIVDQLWIYASKVHLYTDHNIRLMHVIPVKIYFGSTKYVANLGNYQQAYSLTCHPIADTRWSMKIHQMETSPTARSRSRSNSRTKTLLMATLEATLLVSFAVDVFKFTNFCSSLTYFLFSLFIPRSWRLRRSRWRWWWWIWSLLDFKYAVWWNLREANWYSAAR